MKQLLVVTSVLHLIVISLCAPSPPTQKNSSTIYDQRQVGKYNIHFNIKDVSIIAVSSDGIVDHIGDSDAYGDYYDYDDSEYTVNPVTADISGKPTKKPNVTEPLMPTITGVNLSSITTSTNSPSTIPQTIVFIHEKPSLLENDTQVNKTGDTSSVSYQQDEIPVQVIVEPLLKPKIRPAQSMKRKLTNRQVSETVNDDEDEVRPRPGRAQMLERIRARRQQARLSRRGKGCGKGEARDGQGGCRVRRMSGFLNFLTKFLPKRDNE